MDAATRNADLLCRYKPVAVYYEDADLVEYIRRDVPCVNRRVDEFLTLVLDMTERQPIGFKLKGFKNFYLRYVRKSAPSDRDDFLKLVSVIEKATELAGNRVFEREDVRSGYEEARKIATEDDAALHELPNVA